MDYRILGPPEVWSDGRRLALSAVKQRALLATGLLEANHVVSVHRLVDAVWGEDTPPTATALIQTYVSQLRRILAPHAGGEVITTRAPGYLVRVEPGELDLHAFTELAVAGRTSAGARRHAEAASTLRAALALWQGPALDGMVSPLLRDEATRLDELRLGVLEDRIEQDLALDDLDALPAELTGLVAAHPLRERLRGQLMLALYRSGRQADALQAYQQGRLILSAELGIDPDAGLQDLHRAILTADSALRPRRQRTIVIAADAPAAAEQTTVVVPWQVPPAVAELTGRAEQLSAVRSALSAQKHGGPPVVCVEGRAGSGKTALAVTAAHASRDLFPDGQLYATLHGSEPDRSSPPELVLAAFLRALGLPPAQLPDTLEERSGLFRSMIAGRRVLVVLDDAADEIQVRPLLPAHSGAAVLVTSRSSLAGLAHLPIVCDLLHPGDAVALLARIAGADRIAAEPAAAAEIAQLCGGLPLAVRIAGARLAARRSWPLTVLADRLRDEHRRLDELVAGDLAVRAGLVLSYRALPEDVRAGFRLLGALGPVEFPTGTLAALTGSTAHAGEQLAERLADARLIDPAGVGVEGQLRYRLHDLVRLYARERADEEQPAQALTAAMERVMDRLLATIRSTGERTELSDRDAWFDQERRNLVTAVEVASRLGLHRQACEASASLLTFYQRQNSFDDWWRTHDAALAAAGAAGDRRGQAVLLRGLGRLRFEQDRWLESRRYQERALELCRALCDVQGEAAALTGIATVDRELAAYGPALDALLRARELFVALDDTAGRAECAYGLGYIHRDRGEDARAGACIHEALAAYRAIGDQRGTGLTLRSLAMLHRATGDLEQAASVAHEAIDGLARTGDRLLTAYAGQTLAKIHIRQGRLDVASAPLQAALDTCRRYGDRFGTALMLRTLGEFHLASGTHEDAFVYLTSALDGWHTLQLPLFEARTRRDLATLLDSRGDHDAARHERDAALEVFDRYGTRESRELRAVGAVAWSTAGCGLR